MSSDIQIRGITGGNLFLSDDTTIISDGNFITIAKGAAGLKFTPVAALPLKSILTIK